MRTETKTNAVWAICIGAIVIIICMVNSAGAAATLYEGFDYTPTDGTLAINGLNGGTGFDGAWYECYNLNGTDPRDVVVAGETFGSLPVSGGAIQRTNKTGSVATARAISSTAQTVLTQDNSTMWFSVLMKSYNGGTGFAVNSYATLVFGDAGLAGGAATVGTAPSILNSGNAIGVGFCGTQNGTSNYADMRIHGVTYKNGVPAYITGDRIVVGYNLVMIVGKVDWAANGTNDVLSLYNVLDPGAPLPTAFTTMTVDLDQSTFNVLSIGDSQISLFDEIRFGQSYQDVIPIGWTSPSVDAGVDMITWSGEPVQLDPNVVNNDTTDLTFQWSADPAAGVVFNPPSADVEFPEVTITGTTANPSVVTLTLAVNNVGSSNPDITDTMTIDVYDDRCRATIAVDPEMPDPSDLNEDCIIDVQDIVIMAQTWLVDYTATGPLEK